MENSELNNDKYLLLEASKGNEVAFEQLFHLNKHKLYSFLLRLTNSPEMTEDVIQDIFLKLWRDKEKLADIDQFSAYLFRMAQNQCINAFKRMAKETLIMAELQKQSSSVKEDAVENLALIEVQNKLAQALEKLTPQQRLVYTLSREQGLKHDEIARQLQIASSTVNNHMIKALSVIREQMGPHFYTLAGIACFSGILSCFEK